MKRSSGKKEKEIDFLIKSNQMLTAVALVKYHRITSTGISVWVTGRNPCRTFHEPLVLQNVEPDFPPRAAH
jgi:hypothetical protein